MTTLAFVLIALSLALLGLFINKFLPKYRILQVALGVVLVAHLLVGIFGWYD